MADVDVGTIGGSLELADKSFSSTLGEAEKAIGRTDKSASALNRTLSFFSDWAKREGKGAQDILNGIANRILGIDANSEQAAFSADKMAMALGTVASGAVTAALAAVAAGAAAVGTAIVATTAFIVSATIKAANLGDELLTLSKSTGISVERLSFLRYEADQSGVALSTITNSVAKFTADLGTGTKRFEEAVSKAGLSITELRNAKPEEAFQKTIEALGKIPNAADRAAIGTQIFGRKYKDIAALIGEDTEGMRKDFEAFGGTITTEMAVAGDAMNDAKARVASMVEAVTVQIGSVFVPIVATAFKAVGDAWVEARTKVQIDGAKFIEALAKVAEFVIEWAGNTISAVGQVTEILVEFFAAYLIRDTRLIELLAGTGEAIARIAQLQGLIRGDKTLEALAGSIANTLDGIQDLAAKGPGAINDIKTGFQQAADVVTAFGQALAKNAKGSVQAMRDSINEAADAARKGQGDFKGLGEQIRKTANDESSTKAFERHLKRWEKIWADQVSTARKSANEIGKIFLEEVRDNEEADRIMRRLSMSQTQFEITELQRRLDKQRAYYDVLKLMGFDTSRALEAANRRTSASMNEVASKSDEFRLGLLGVVAAMSPLTSGLLLASDEVKGLAGEFSDAEDDAKKFAETVVDVINDVGNAIRGAIEAGGSAGDVLGAVGNVLGQRMISGIQSSISKAVSTGAISGITAAAGTVAAMGVAMGLDYVLKSWEDARNRAAARDAGRAAAEQFAAGFGGMVGARRFARLAGIDSIDMSHVLSPSSPEMFEAALNRISPQIQAFQNQMKGFETAARGVDTLMAGIGMSFAKSMEDQTKALTEAQKAHIEMLKAGGATQEQIEKDNALFAESMKTHTFQATEAQIAAFNRLGTIAGGVIANMVAKTGDLVGAILSVGDTLGKMVEIRDKFGLGDQVNAATAEVLKLYETFKNNEDVFTSISGIGQIMVGLGDALVHNQGLANAFGQQLAADFQTLVDRGVDVNLALASMAPQLQELWELQKDGRLTVDATTQALLDQAEAAGVVGDVQRDVNEKILGVLGEIRDLIGLIGNVALPRMGTAADSAGRAVGRSLNEVASAGRSARDAVRDVENGLRGIKAPPPIDIKVGWDIEDPDWERFTPPRYEPDPNRATPRTAEFSGGSDGFRNFRDGTPAILHGVERVQTFAQYMNERGASANETSTIVVEVDGEAIVAADVRNRTRYTRIRAGASPRTVR